MTTFLHAVLLWFVFKGVSFLFFPNFMQNFIGQNIIDAKITDLKVFGALLLFTAFLFWLLVLKHIG